jgi:hypothetical protein
MAVDQMQLDKSRCVIIEDSGIGLGAAKAAGIPCLVTKSSYTAEEDFSGASMVVDELGDSPANGVTLTTLEGLLQADTVGATTSTVSIATTLAGRTSQKAAFKQKLAPQHPAWEYGPSPAPLGPIGGETMNKKGLEYEYPEWEYGPSPAPLGQIVGETMNKKGLEHEYPEWEIPPARPAFGEVRAEDPFKHQLEIEYPDWEPAQPTAPPPTQQVGGYGPTRHKTKMVWPEWKAPPPRPAPTTSGQNIEGDPFRQGLEVEYPEWEPAPSKPPLGEVGAEGTDKSGVTPVWPSWKPRPPPAKVSPPVAQDSNHGLTLRFPTKR